METPPFDPPLQFFLPELDRIRVALRSASTKYGIKMLDDLVATIREMENCPECVAYRTYSTHAEGHSRDVRCGECGEWAVYISTYAAQIGQAFCRRHWRQERMFQAEFVLWKNPINSEWLIVKNRFGKSDLPSGFEWLP